MSRFDPPPETLQSRKLKQSLAGVAISGLALFIVFFIVFANNLPRPPENVPKADGIVVFTGTANERMIVGMELLHAKKGQRLLISGVYEDQSFETILAQVPDIRDAVACCIDLDPRATNTVQNAAQTAIWAQVHDFNSLIIVTSAHHVPRAFLEMRRAMPTMRLSAWPVVPANVKLEAWWRYPGTFSLLLGEYVRYLYALAGLPGSD